MKVLYFVKNNLGFTLIEMMIVLMIISILLLISIPNVKNNNDIANARGCEATIELLQAQVAAYYVEHKNYPLSLKDLEDNNYVDKITCPNGTELILDESYKVVIANQ